MHLSRTTLVFNARSFTVMALVFGAASLCSAAPITYNVDRTVDGGRGSVIGTVETDGTIGVLSSGNFLGFNLLINVIGTTDDAVSGSHSQIAFVGSDLSATATQLLFNFSGPIDNGVHFIGDDGIGGWCFQSGSDGNFGANCFDGVPSEEALNLAGAAATVQSGTQVMASVGPAVASTPEPSTLALLAAGIALIGFRKSKYKEQQSYRSRKEAVPARQSRSVYRGFPSLER